MVKIKSMLFSYLEKKCNKSCKKENMLAYITKFNLNRIFLQELKNIDINAYDDAMLLIENQKEKNENFLKEIKTLSDLAVRNKIKLVFLKGFFLGRDIYDPPYVRKSNDIDMLVDIRDLKLMDSILKEVGYVTYREDYHINTLSNTLKYKTIQNDITHIVPYQKKIETDGIETIIYIDLHINPLHEMPLLLKEEPESILFRAARECYEPMDIEVWVLELHDRLVHLLGHFTRDYYLDFRKHLRWNIEYVMRLSLIHDIALLIEKYKTSIEWNNILERAKFMGQMEYVVFAISVLNAIYNELIPEEILQKIKAHITPQCDIKDYRKRLIAVATREDIDALIFNDSNRTGNRLLQLMRKDIPIQNCFNATINKKNNIELKKVFYNKNNMEILDDSILQANPFYKNSNDFKGTSEVTWTSSSVIVKIQLDLNNYFNEENFKQICVSFARDETSTCFDEFEVTDGNDFFSTAKSFYFNPYKDTIDKTLRLQIGKNQFVVLQKDDFLFESDTKNIFIKLIIPWFEIKIKPYILRIIDIQIACDFHCSEEDDVYTARQILCADGCNDFYPLPTEFARIQLI